MVAGSPLMCLEIGFRLCRAKILPCRKKLRPHRAPRPPAGRRNNTALSFPLLHPPFQSFGRGHSRLRGRDKLRKFGDIGIAGIISASIVINYQRACIRKESRHVYLFLDIEVVLCPFSKTVS
jgi:hypothetical protein